ncbi:MAG: T9SS type A sorting domain-containing protein [Mariniphaga sp.]|nr:T9SS type A sorting domain-containing protein [Mariniphaga sp.]
MVDEIWDRNENAIVIFEHLADNSEEKVLADYGILLWGNMNGNYGEAAMGYNENNKSDMSWGVYSNRNWNEPNLVTYMESHDEERLTYKCIQFGKTEGNYSVKQLPVALDRMALNSAFLIPLPGPKMIWQFGERGYDQSINSFGGRLNEKPPLWEYLDDEKRLELFNTVAKLNFLKQTYEEFVPQVFTSNLAGDIKWYKLNTGSNHVFVVGNFSTHEIIASVSFSVMGQWFEYFSKTTFDVDVPPQNLTLAPGEFRLYSTRQFEDPHIKTDTKTIQITELGFVIYPNPASDKIYIESETPFNEICIYSVRGKKVLTNKYNSERKTNLDMNGFLPGLYIIRISQKNKVFTQKLIIR